MIVTSQQTSESAGDYVYRILRKNIIQGILAPGTCISPVETANELKVSRTPIQSAFARLAADGLLEVMPQRGSYVSIIDLKRVYESVYMRNLMDQAAIRYLCRSDRLEKALVDIEANVQRQVFCLEKNLMDELMELDYGFHNIIYIASDMENISRAVDSISADQHRVREMKLYSKIRWGETVTEHKEIFHALQKGDGEGAARLSFEHVSKFGVDIDSVYFKNPDFFSNWHAGLSGQFTCKLETINNMDKK